MVLSIWTQNPLVIYQKKAGNDVIGEHILLMRENMDLIQPRILGSTGLKVGRLGVAASYGAPANVYEEAFEKGCNYFYWGSQRKIGMGRAIQNICGQGKRDQLVIVIQSYSRSAFLMDYFYKGALKSLGLDYADILLLGWHNHHPTQRLLDRALKMRDQGLFRFLGLSGHNRLLFPQLAKEDLFDLFHIRYNAAHRGAENETFPQIQAEPRPGIITYTATRWGQLLNPQKIPPGQIPPSGSDCYRFVLTHSAVDVCMCGPKNLSQMREALKSLGLGPLNEDELARMRQIGDHVHKKSAKFF
jgi:predicted aldo/keto reductase-like oxidoreductase